MTSPWYRYVFLRHGQSLNNALYLSERKKDMVPDHKDTLSEKGESSVLAASKNIITLLARKPQPFKKYRVLCSPQERCIQTAKILIQQLTVNGFEQTKTMHEYDELREIKRNEVTNIQKAHNWGEIAFQIPENPDIVTIVVTHGQILRTGLHYKMNWPQHVQFGPGTASITMLDFQPNPEKYVLHVMGEASHTGPKSYTWKNNDLFS